MRKLMILLALSATATSVLADNSMPRADAATQPVQASKQMSDADLDSITAGAFAHNPPGNTFVQIVRTDEGLISITNPGNASVNRFHREGARQTCVNQPCGAPPPPVGF